MRTDIANKIEASKAKAAPTRKEKQANREAVKQLAALHMEAAIKKLGDIISDKNAPASARVAAATQLLDRVAGKPKLIDERETEKSQLERMSDTDTLQYICDHVSGLSAQARSAIAQSLLAAERGLTAVDVRDIVDPDFNEVATWKAVNEPPPPAELPPLERKRKEPRR
jgi:hypothetical protein